MNLSSYITAAVDLLSNDTFTLSGETVDCVYNQTTYKFGDKNYGFPSEDTLSLTFNTSEFPTIKNYKGKNLTHNSQSFRIIDVIYGAYSSTVVIVDSKKL